MASNMVVVVVQAAGMKAALVQRGSEGRELLLPVAIRLVACMWCLTCGYRTSWYATTITAAVALGSSPLQ